MVLHCTMISCAINYQTTTNSTMLDNITSVSAKVDILQLFTGV